MDNRERLLTALAVLIEVAGDETDDLAGALALLCACGAAIAARAEDEMIKAVRPIIARLTAESMPELWAAIEQMRRANNAANN